MARPGGLPRSSTRANVLDTIRYVWCDAVVCSAGTIGTWKRFVNFVDHPGRAAGGAVGSAKCPLVPTKSTNRGGVLWLTQ